MNSKLQKKKLIYMGLLGVMLLGGCKNKENINNSNINTNNKMFYRKNSIYLIYDINKCSCEEFILNTNVNNDYMSEEIYSVNNDSVVFASDIPCHKNDIYYRYLKSLPNVVFFENLESYLPSSAIKDYYTIDEIRFLEPYIFNELLRRTRPEKFLVK